MRRYLSAFIALYLFWVLLSGYFTPFLLSAGVGCTLAMLWFARRMDIIDGEGHPIEMARRAVAYWLWLFVEIAKSGWTVSRIIWNPSLPISPTMVRFRPLQRTAAGLVTHANSITLTPGTITVEATPGEFIVHGLTSDSAQGTIASEMDRRVAACEGPA
jgi:multicomponent Na+:H+ antiporter subunit E